MRNYDNGQILGFAVFARDVSTTGVDVVRLQPWISVFVGTVLPGTLAVVRTDCHVPLLVEDVIRRLGHIWEPLESTLILDKKEFHRVIPTTLGWAATISGLFIFSCLLFDIRTCKRPVILALCFQLFVGKIGAKEGGFHVF